TPTLEPSPTPLATAEPVNADGNFNVLWLVPVFFIVLAGLWIYKARSGKAKEKDGSDDSDSSHPA
ncbi:MAG: hypothetical protein WA110_07495, partial [Anaerolineaceae bacterium]